MTAPAPRHPLPGSPAERMRLAVALSQCRLAERRLLALLFVERLEAREVAEVLDLTLAEVMRRRAALLARLRRMGRGLVASGEPVPGANATNLRSAG